MIGKCPHCGIKLNEPPFGERELNEVMILIRYREMMESGMDIEDIGTLGYCKVCNAKKGEVEGQRGK